MKLSRLLITTVALSSLVTPVQGVLATQNTVTNENDSTRQPAIGNSTSIVVGVTSSNERNVQTSASTSASTSTSQASVNSNVVQSNSTPVVEVQKSQTASEGTWQDIVVRGLVQTKDYDAKVYDANGKATGRQLKSNTLWATGIKHVNNSNKAVYYQVSKAEFLSAQDVVFKDANVKTNVNKGTVTNISGLINVNYKPGYGVNVYKDHASTTNLVKQIMHGSQWKVFKKWTDGHQTWYNLGGDQWVKSDYVRYSEPGQEVVGTTTDISGSITVNYTPGYGIYVRKGHDSSTSAVKRIMHGSQWKVFKKWTDGHQTWYNLGGDQWVKSDYARYSKPGQVVTGITTNINGSITVKYTPGYGVYIRKGHDSSTSAVKRIMHGSQWKVFKKWTDGHQTWYNLGGDQWVKSDYAIYSKPGQVADGTTTNVSGLATVNYKSGYGINVYKGHGSNTGFVKRIMHGSQWKVFKKWTDGHQAWYNLGGNQWVNSDYLVITHSSYLPSVNLTNVPLISQLPELPNGCEITAVTMMLQYSGAHVTKMQMAHSMPFSSNPNYGYIGRPWDSSGITIFPPALMNLVEKNSGTHTAKNLTGQGFDAIKYQLNQGHPVVTWHTMHGFPYHALTVTGYDQYNVYYNDCWTNKRTSMTINKFLSNWATQKQRAISY